MLGFHPLGMQPLGAVQSGSQGEGPPTTFPDVPESHVTALGWHKHIINGFWSAYFSKRPTH